jgi:hypothetical protein
VPSQRLLSGELAFLAADVPALGWRGYRVAAGDPAFESRAPVRENVLENGRVVLEGTSEELLSNRDVQRAYLGSEVMP